MPLDETEAWEQMRTAILRYQADPTEKNLAEVRRRGRVLEAAMGRERMTSTTKPPDEQGAARPAHPGGVPRESNRLALGIKTQSAGALCVGRDPDIGNEGRSGRIASGPPRGAAAA
jgi:hypothetical protein